MRARTIHDLPGTCIFKNWLFHHIREIILRFLYHLGSASCASSAAIADFSYSNRRETFLLKKSESHRKRTHSPPVFHQPASFFFQPIFRPKNYWYPISGSILAPRNRPFYFFLSLSSFDSFFHEFCSLFCIFSIFRKRDPCIEKKDY